MKKYFLILGIIELIAVFIGAIYFISVIIAKGFLIYDVKETIKLIVLFIAYLIFAPAFGLLFVSHSKSLPERVYETENQQQNYDTFISDKKRKNENEVFLVGDRVECIDINLLNKYGVNSEGKVVYIHGENVGVKFGNEKGHYTLSLSENQIKKILK